MKPENSMTSVYVFETMNGSCIAWRYTIEGEVDSRGRQKIRRIPYEIRGNLKAKMKWVREQLSPPGQYKILARKDSTK